MCNTIVGAGAVGAGAALRYGSGSDQKMRLLAAPAPAPQHWLKRCLMSIFLEILTKDISYPSSQGRHVKDGVGSGHLKTSNLER
jgi:hypothetical protein